MQAAEVIRRINGWDDMERVLTIDVDELREMMRGWTQEQVEEMHEALISDSEAEIDNSTVLGQVHRTLGVCAAALKGSPLDDDLRTSDLAYTAMSKLTAATRSNAGDMKIALSEANNRLKQANLPMVSLNGRDLAAPTGVDAAPESNKRDFALGKMIILGIGVLLVIAAIVYAFMRRKHSDAGIVESDIASNTKWI